MVLMSLEEIKLKRYIVKSEDSLVRTQLISGTHALAVTLSALLRPNDTMLSITGEPYDTLKTVIGIGKEESKSSLKSYNIKYEQIDLVDNDFDIKKIEIGESLVDLLIRLGASQSKREAREFITNGAITINGEKYTDVLTTINDDMFIYNYLIIKRGKKNYYIASK